MVSVDGEEAGTLHIQVPEKESEEQKGQEQSQELTPGRTGEKGSCRRSCQI